MIQYDLSTHSSSIQELKSGLNNFRSLSPNLSYEKKLGRESKKKLGKGGNATYFGTPTPLSGLFPIRIAHNYESKHPEVLLCKVIVKSNRKHYLQWPKNGAVLNRGGP
jgi:hypothetical protein